MRCIQNQSDFQDRLCLRMKINSAQNYFTLIFEFAVLKFSTTELSGFLNVATLY